MKHESPIFLQVDQICITHDYCLPEDIGAIQPLTSFNFFIYVSAHFKISLFSCHLAKEPLLNLFKHGKHDCSLV